MKIGLLSICTMMFVLYGTDCRAETPNENMDFSQEVKSESFQRVFPKSRKNALRKEKRKNKMRQAFENPASNATEVSQANDSASESHVNDVEKDSPVNDSKGKITDFRGNRSYADVVKGVKRPDNAPKEENSVARLKKKFEQGSYEEERMPNEAHRPDLRIEEGIVEKRRKMFDEERSNVRRRSYADVVKGVKEQDGNVREGIDDSKQFYDAIDPEFNASNKSGDVIPNDQNTSEKEKEIEKKQSKIAPPRTNRSKKAYEARRNRQSKTDQDEFSKKWKSANKTSNYRRK